MGFYQEELLPRLQDKVMAHKPNRAVRARVFDQGGTAFIRDAADHNGGDQYSVVATPFRAGSW
jgi:hypothetical protein